MRLPNPSWLKDAARNQDAHRGASNRRRASNGMCLLLVPQWLQPDIKSATRYVKTHLRFLCNGRRMTLSTSPISVIVALASNQIGDAPPYNAPWINF
jgi:hypothetical protein